METYHKSAFPTRVPVGGRGWTSDLPQYPLPEGLPDNAPVWTMGYNHGYARVRDDHGREWEVFVGCVELEREYQVEGRWVAQNDPRVLDDYERRLAEIYALPPPPTDARKDSRAFWVRRLARVLSRHGRQPDIREIEPPVT